MTPMRVTLSSDFGRYYPAAMRGVLRGRGIAEIDDVAHHLPRQDVPQSAFWLRTILPYYPPSVHCVVVDPGVGTDRRVLVIRAGSHALVGPDNGVLWPTARTLAGATGPEPFVFHHVDPASRTFHGRDVFSPLAAAVAHLGATELHRLPTLEATDEHTRLTLPRPTIEPGRIETTVLAVDAFGNIVTGVPGKAIEDRFGGTIEVADEAIPLRPYYGAVDHGEALVTVGSHGYVELAVNHGSGAERFGLGPGDDLVLVW